MNIGIKTNSRFAAIAAAVTLAGGMMLCTPAFAHAAASVNTSVEMGKSYSKAVANGKTAGKATANASAFSGMKVSLKGVKGSIHYQVTNTKRGLKAGQDGKAAAAPSGATVVKVFLSGAAAKKYDVYYRTYTQGYGWLGWARNGDYAGTTVQGKVISAVQVKLALKRRR